MRGAGAVGRRGLGGADIEFAIERERIAAYDFASKTLGE
jgi:hypothetical protein